jgi:hypothetical protein
MRGRIGGMSWLAVGGLLLGAVAARAGDTVKLSLPASTDAPALKLGQIGLDADTIDAASHGHGGHGGGFHGGHAGGFHGGHASGFHGGHVGHYHAGYHGHYGGYGGYRGYYGGHYHSYYRPYYSFGYYRPYYASRYYYGYSPYYYSSYYTEPSVYYYSSPIYCPIGLETTPSYGTPSYSAPNYNAPRVMPPADALNYQPDAQTLPRQPGTFPYDGGPRLPVPMPRIENPGDVPPTRLSPTPTVPLDGRPVSLLAPQTTPVKYTYPAYGELPRKK